MGADAVLAAGDATTFPIKQGGLATQQADAAAATIAHALGATVEPTPFAPVLRGLLLTGGAPLYLRAELDRQRRRALGRARARGVSPARSPRVRCGGRPARSPAATSRRTSPRLALCRWATSRSSTACRRPLAPVTPTEHEAALELALLLADEDAAAGDYAQALHALDAAAALAGGVLPAAYAERRERWLAELTAA